MLLLNKLQANIRKTKDFLRRKPFVASFFFVVLSFLIILNGLKVLLKIQMFTS